MHYFNIFLSIAAVVFGLAAAPITTEELAQFREQALAAIKSTSTKTYAPRTLPTESPNPVIRNVQVGERPYFLVQNMTDSRLKRKLQNCSEGPFSTTDFSISHRGAPLQFPEHTAEGRAAAARQGAGLIECDITFTKDRELVCRHSQCDLHTTTNILVVPELAAKCSKTFAPATENTPASAICCTSDITLAEFKSLCGKQEGFNASATTPLDYLTGTPNWRTDLYSTCGKLTSHAEFIEEIAKLGLSFTPETKVPLVKMPFEGDYTQEMYIQQAVDEYKAAGIHPSRVWFQSFVLSDVLYLLEAEPDFGHQAMYLDERVETEIGYKTAISTMQAIARRGVQIIAPAFPYLLAVDEPTKRIVPSEYAISAQKAGLKLVTWTLERSGPLAKVGETGDYYYSTILDVIKWDGQVYEVLDVLVQEVKIIGIFSDWPGTATYYANCFGLKGGFGIPLDKKLEMAVEKDDHSEL